jgi:hypothetical protein
MVQVDDGFQASEVPMTKIAIGNIIPDAKIVEKIRAETEAKNKPPVKADADSWRRSKNKAFRRKMAKQREGGVPAPFLHERKKGR